MIKYLGSKRRLLTLIVQTVSAVGEGLTVVDLFSGTSRVGHALKRAGHRVLANDYNAYAETLARCYVETDREEILQDATRLVAEFNGLPGRAGWFTQLYCEEARYLHPRNGARVEAIREAIEAKQLPMRLRAVMLAALMEAADRVDSTTGVQMAYLKAWAPRALRDLELRVPEVLPRVAAGRGEAYRLDACLAAERLAGDVAYIDPPYNQHSYLGNYHVWETLVRWDRPEVYGVARKRVECRERRSAFNNRRQCHAALQDLLTAVRAPVLVVSGNDEGHVSRKDLEALLTTRGVVHVIEQHGQRRYVGAQIGIHDPRGRKVGTVGRLHNTEYLYVVAPRDSRTARSFARVEAGA
ncbi:MAG: DNA adenine methylase [Planctomycetota bacterium]|jgi:adenine-specific DNA-methyltransferase